jgi:hypothetical protein
MKEYLAQCFEDNKSVLLIFQTTIQKTYKFRFSVIYKKQKAGYNFSYYLIINDNYQKVISIFKSINLLKFQHLDINAILNNDISI